MRLEAGTAARQLRDYRIESRFRAGETMLAIAAAVGIHKTRVCQILRARGVSRSIGGAAERSRRKKFNSL